LQWLITHEIKESEWHRLLITRKSGSGSDAFQPLDPGSRSGWGKNPDLDPGSGRNIPDYFSESLETFLELKIF
jgi:hypothetical protein